MSVLRAHWRQRSDERLPEHLWRATIQRVRGEFEEMPALCVTLHEARALFGLSDRVCTWVLGRLESDGFLGRNGSGEYVKQGSAP